MHFPEAQSDAQVTESTIVAKRRRCLLIPADVRDSSVCENGVQATVDGFGWIEVFSSRKEFV